jgi:hypothetical protein
MEISAEIVEVNPCAVMAGLVPAIHVLLAEPPQEKT